MQFTLLIICLARIIFAIGCIYFTVKVYQLINNGILDISLMEWKVRFIFGAMIVEILSNLINKKVSITLFLWVILFILSMVELKLNK